MIGGITLAVLLYAGVLIYLTWPISNFSISSSGTFGDSFGLLTSLFSGLAFAGLIITINMQKDELSLQREELSLTRSELNGQKEEMIEQNATLRIQRFENTFFKMLELLESCRNDIRHNQHFQNSGPSLGRDAIKKFYEAFVEYNLHSWDYSNINPLRTFNESCLSISGISNAYKEFYKSNAGEEIGHYYRTLYNIIKLVDQSDFIDNKNLYTNLVRAQLSRYEISLLFYNCLSDFGSEKMSPLIKKYNILKHLEESTLTPEHLDLWKSFNSQA